MDIEARARLLFGITVIVIALGIAAWYLWSESRVITCQFLTGDNVSGLTRDAPVEFHGVQVGKVTQVRLIGPASVRIVAEIDRDAPLTAATRATIISRGLSPKGFTGYVTIALEDPGTDRRPPAINRGDRFPTIPIAGSRDISLDAEISQANELIHVLLDKATLQSLKEAVESARTISGTLAENNARLNALIANSERASRQLAPLLRSSGDSINALQNQVLPEAYKALTDLENLTDALNGTAAAIGRDPSVLLRGRAPPPPAPGERR